MARAAGLDAAPRLGRAATPPPVTCALLDEAITALPPRAGRRPTTTCDGACASHALVKELDRLAARHGYQVTYSVGWELGTREKAAIGTVPEAAWQIAIDGRGQVRERRDDGACADPALRPPPVLDRGSTRRRADRAAARRAGRRPAQELARRPCASSPAASWPHPGAQLSLFEAAGGWRYCLWVTNLPATTKGWRGQCAYIDAAHRVHARVEDVIRTGKHPAAPFPLA